MLWCIILINKLSINKMPTVWRDRYQFFIYENYGNCFSIVVINSVWSLVTNLNLNKVLSGANNEIYMNYNNIADSWNIIKRSTTIRIYIFNIIPSTFHKIYVTNIIFFIHHKFPRFIFSCTHTFVHLVAILFSLINL